MQADSEAADMEFAGRQELGMTSCTSPSADRRPDPEFHLGHRGVELGGESQPTRLVHELIIVLNNSR